MHHHYDYGLPICLFRSILLATLVIEVLFNVQSLWDSQLNYEKKELL